VPHKNIAQVGGRPLLAWTVAAAQESGVLERLLVSTDDPEIRDQARACGAEAPFLRPMELARDDTSSADVLLHALEWLDRNEGYRPSYVVLLQPTSPLRNAADIQAAMHLAIEKQADCVVSVCPTLHHPSWAKTICPDGRLLPFLHEEKTPIRRQELPSAYAVNGAIYLARREWFLARRSFCGDDTYAYIMPQERSLDVDTHWDLYLADLILQDQTCHGDARNCRP
jgi:CMP-N-acetylneuraminic acid synthetase